MRLIDAEKIEWGAISMEFDSGTITLEGPYAEKAQIDKLPTIDPESLRPETRFFKTGSCRYYCDKCNAEFRHHGRLSWKICPICGAKITEVENNED